MQNTDALQLNTIENVNAITHVNQIKLHFSEFVKQNYYNFLHQENYIQACNKNVDISIPETKLNVLL